MLLVAGLVRGWWCAWRPAKVPAVAIVTAGLLSLLIAHWPTVRTEVRTVMAGHYRSVPRLIEDYAGRFKDRPYDTIVPFSIPAVSPFISFNAELYYGSGAKFINPLTNPGANADTEMTLSARLAHFPRRDVRNRFHPV